MNHLKFEAMADHKEKDLFYLHELTDYKVASGYADVRNWKMKDAEGKTIGKVKGLLVSKKAERVVYLDVEVDPSVIEAGHDPYETQAGNGIHEFLNTEGEDHLIVPIGMADIDEDNKTVMSNGISHSMFAKAKRYNQASGISREYEAATLATYQPATDKWQQDDNSYNRNAFGHNPDIPNK